MPDTSQTIRGLLALCANFEAQRVPLDDLSVDLCQRYPSIANPALMPTSNARRVVQAFEDGDFEPNQRDIAVFAQAAGLPPAIVEHGGSTVANALAARAARRDLEHLDAQIAELEAQRSLIQSDLDSTLAQLSPNLREML